MALPGRRGGVYALLMEVEIDALRMDLADEAHEILKGAAQAIHGPCCDEIELLAGDALEELVEPRPSRARR